MKKLYILLISAATGVLSLSAQTNQVSSMEAPPILTPAARARIVATPVESLDPADQVGPIVLRKMQLGQVFDLLQTYSGRIIIPSAGLPKVTFNFKSAGTMRRDEAILALETLLNLNGVMLALQSNGFVEAIPHAQALRRGPQMLEAGETGGEAEQQVYGRIYELEHLDSRTMYVQIRNMLSLGGLSSIFNLEWRNALLVFDTQHNLDALGKVIEMLDQPVEHRAEVFVVPVKNSSVWNVYSALIHAQRNRANAALYRARFHGDTSANHLVVVAPPEARAYIEELIETLDREIAPMTTSQIFPIREGNVRTIYSILYGMVRHQQSQFSRKGFRSQETYRTTQQLQPSQESMLPEEGLEGEVPTETPAVADVVADLAEQSAELQFSPYMGVWIDYQNYSIVAYGTPADMKRVEELIDKLDRETAPYTETDIIKLSHAHAPNVGKLLNHMVQVQRSMFSRQGLESGASREGREGGAENAFEFSPYMYLWTERANNAIMVYGTKDDIERIKGIIAKLDVAQAPVTESKTIEIQHTQARTVADMIGRIINNQRYAYMREGFYTGGARSEGEAETAGLETGFEFTPYAMVTADRTGNALFVYGTARDIQRVEELLVDLDRETAPITKSKVYYLKHADAYSLSRIVSQVIQAQRRVFEKRGLQSGENSAQPDPSAQTEIEMGFEFSDFATVVADRRSNSLLLYGTDSDIVRVDAIISETDIPVEPITTSRVFALKHAEANSLSRVLQIIVSSQRRAIRSVESAGGTVKNPDSTSVGSVEGEPALQFSPFLSIVPDARNNALIIYGTHADLEHVGQLIDQTDVEVAPLTRSEVFILENAQARTLSSILTRMIRSQQTAMRQVQSRFHAVQYRKGEDEEDTPSMMFDPNQPMQFSPYVSVVANDRNNTLLVYGTESDLAQLRDIVTQNDTEVAPRTQSRIFYIKHADANDVARTITPLITAQQRVREREATLRRFFRRRDGELDEAAAAAVGMEPDMNADASDLGMTESGLDFDEDLQFSPYVTLSADDRSNSIIVYGTEFDLRQVEDLITKVDRVLPQVNIEVVIAEVMLQDGQVSGLDSFGISYDNPFPFQVDGANNGGVASRGGVLGGTPSLESGGDPAGQAGIGLDPFSMQMVFNTAKEDGMVRILSAPNITTTHNRPASINVGEARPIITSSTSSLNNPNLTTRSTVEYRDIGIELQVRPLVGDGGVIQMEVEQTVETVIDTQTIDNNEQPIIGTRRANSFVSIADNDIIVMGGLQSEATIVSEGSVWILGDIPLLGKLFRPKKRTSTVRELIIFIRPKLVAGTTREEEIDRQLANPGQVTEDVVIFLENGRFAGQLPEPPPQIPEGDELPESMPATNVTEEVINEN